MTELHQRHCLNHGAREAVARCPECGHCYCRECITEHEDRVICAACLRKTLRLPEKKRRPMFVGFARAMVFCLSLMAGWLAFYLVGKLLLSIPTSFHDGTLWKTGFWQE
jgi:hypothetical protein